MLRFVFILLAFLCFVQGSHAQTVLPDSLLTVDKIYEYTFSDFETARQIASTLRSRQTQPDIDLDIAEGDLYFNTGKYYRALACYERVLGYKGVLRNDTLYMEQLHRMISCFDALHRTDKQTEYVERLLDKAKSCGNEAMQSVALFNMGKMLYNQGLHDKGLEQMEEAIDIMRRSDYKYKYDNLRYNYNVLLVFHEQDKRYEEELRVLDELEQIISASTGRERHDMQQLDRKELKSVYAHRAIALHRLGRTAEAERNYELFLTVADVFTRDNYLIMPYLFDKKRYDDIILMNRRREQQYRQSGDTVSYHMSTIKRSLANAYASKGDYRTASELYRELAALTTDIKYREQESAALELAALYDLNSKNTQLLEQKSSLRIRLIIIACLIVGLSFLLFYYHRMRAKNKLLVLRLDEMLELDEELRRLKEEVRRHGLSFVQSVDTELAEQPADERRMANKRLFDTLDREIRQHRLYLQPDLGRDELIALIGVDKNRFAEIIRDNTEGRLTDYLNAIRIAHAIQVMKEKRNYTLQAVALESGFVNMTTFSNAFKRYTGLTPSQYRKVKSPTA